MPPPGRTPLHAGRERPKTQSPAVGADRSEPKITDVTITIPSWLEHFAVRALLLARRLRYGYAFRRIPLTRGKFAIVDPQDYKRLSAYKWRICAAPNTFYAERGRRSPKTGRWSRLLMHRQLIDVPQGYCIDHINGNGLDNRRANLRLATPAQNAWNAKTRCTNRTGYKGVCFDKQKKKYRAAIVANGRRFHLGYFTSPIDAARAYDHAANIYHGDFAAGNFDS